MKKKIESLIKETEKSQVKKKKIGKIEKEKPMKLLELKTQYQWNKKPSKWAQ